MKSVDKELIFAKPVSTSIAPDYHSIIKKPMDLSLLEKNVDRFEYPNFESFTEDLLLIPDNCMKYNPPTLIWHKYAIKFRRAAVALIEKALASGILVNSVDADTNVLPLGISPVMTGYAVEEPEKEPAKHIAKKKKVESGPKAGPSLNTGRRRSSRPAFFFEQMPVGPRCDLEDSPAMIGMLNREVRRLRDKKRRESYKK
jgi:hypothetical protein